MDTKSIKKHIDDNRELYTKLAYSISCGGKNCNNNMDVRFAEKTCKFCGRYICKECFNKSGFCKDHS